MATTTDLVCGMEVEESAAVGSINHEGAIYYFCSRSCLELFQADSDKYTNSD